MMTSNINKVLVIAPHADDGELGCGATMVLIPNRNDVHQDHAVIAAESIRAFKFLSIWGYELPWNNLSSTSNNYIKLDKAHIDKKIKAIQCYNSQNHRTYINGDFIRSLAKIRGTQIAAEYAESFEIIRQII